MASKSTAAEGSTHGQYDRVLVDIITYVYRYEIQSSRAWRCAKIVLLDALGCALETLTESDEARALIGPVIPGATVPNGFKLPGTPYQLDILKGSFDLGSLIRYLDHNDAFPGAESGHPSDNIGAILAVADWLSRTAKASGQEIITIEKVLIAIIKAYEIQGCFQIRNNFHQIGLDHTILVKIASTAVVSWLLDLSETQAMDALSQAWADSAPLCVFRHSPNTGSRTGWAAGDACMRAIHLAWLTKKGQPGAPTALTAPRWGFYATLFKGREFQLPRPFETWVIESVLFKIYPAEEHGASAVEAAVEVAKELSRRGLSVEKDVAHIRVRTQQAAMVMINNKSTLHTAADRGHCMQYMVAVVLLKGSMIERADYQDRSPWAKDMRVEALRKKIKLAEEPQFTSAYHDDKKRSVSNALTITLKNGTKLKEVICEYPVGHPWRKETAISVRQKLRNNVEGWYGKGRKAQDIMKLEPLPEDHLRKMPVCDFVDQFAGG